MAKKFFQIQIVLLAAGLMLACGGKEKNVSPEAESLEQAEETTGEPTGDVETTNASHLTYQGLSMGQTIESFRKGMEDELGLALGEIDKEHCLYKFYDQFKAVWVYYDADSHRVFMAKEIDLHYFDMYGEGDALRRQTDVGQELSAKYGVDLTAYDSNIDCLDFGNGYILIGYDEEMGVVVCWVDRINSNDYDNLMDDRYLDD